MPKSRLMTKKDKFKAIWQLGRARLSGLITQESLEESIVEILTNEPELPLGIGAVMSTGQGK